MKEIPHYFLARAVVNSNVSMIALDGHILPIEPGGDFIEQVMQTPERRFTYHIQDFRLLVSASLGLIFESGWLHSLEPNTFSRVVKMNDKNDELLVSVSSAQGELFWCEDGVINYHYESTDGFYDLITQRPLNHYPFAMSNGATMVYLAGECGAQFVTLANPDYYEGMETPVETGDAVSQDPEVTETFWQAFLALRGQLLD